MHRAGWRYPCVCRLSTSGASLLQVAPSLSVTPSGVSLTSSGADFFSCLVGLGVFVFHLLSELIPRSCSLGCQLGIATTCPAPWSRGHLGTRPVGSAGHEIFTLHPASCASRGSCGGFLHPPAPSSRGASCDIWTAR